MSLLFTYFNYILAWSCIYFPMMNFLAYPLKRKYKFSFLFIFALFDLLFTPKIGIYTNIPIFLFILLLCSLAKQPIINICLSILGYLFTVCVNYFFILLLRPLGIAPILLETNYSIVFSILFAVFIYITSFFLGKRINMYIIQWQLARPKPLLSRKVQLLCLLELFACFIIYQFNTIYGNIVGHSSQIINYNAMLFFTFFIITLIILCFLFLTLKKDAELTAKLQVFEVLQDYTAKVESLYLEIRTFKHDYLNILSTMELYMKEKRYTDLQHYFESKILPQGRSLVSNDAVLGKLAKLKIPELKSLLYPKLLVALNHHLDAVVDIKNDTTSIPVDYLDLTRILGIFMDNAIEAAVETQEKTLYIGFHTYDNTTIIRIRNSCNPVEHIDHIFDLDYSTKPGSRGIGLYNANLLIHKHPNIILKTTCGDNMFTQELKIIEGD